MADLKMAKGDSESVYRSLIYSVFADSRVMGIGVLTTPIAVIMTALTSGSEAIGWLAAVFFTLGGMRYAMVRRFEADSREARLETEQLRVWETRFTIAAIIYASLFGFWCLLAAMTNDDFATMASLVTTLANTIGIFGRSYPIARLVNLQLLAISVPAIGGLIYHGGYYTLFGFFLAPYMIGINHLAALQRRNLLDNINEHRKAQKLATQLHTTLNNLPQGICMFDADGGLEVANRPVLTTLQQPWRKLENLSFNRLLTILEQEQSLVEEDSNALANHMLSPSSRPFVTRVEMGNHRRRTVKIRTAPMNNGGMVCTFEDITREIETTRKIDRMTRFDPLTGLANRNEFQNLLKRRVSGLRADQSCAVLLFNVDRFKQINDIYGHHLGDAVLKRVAEILVELSGTDAVCARFSSDEFAIMLDAESDLDHASALADDISEALSNGIDADERHLQIGSHIGISCSLGRQVTAEQLLKQADLALLWARRAGPGEWRRFHSQMDEEVRTQRELETDLRLALRTNGLEVAYQPIVNATQRTVTVCEALARWNHPTRGMVPPSTFVPIAENLGLIAELGNQVLRQACRDCATWPDNIRVAVNLSPLQLRHDDIIDIVKQALADNDLDPSRLELEVTESAMIDDMEQCIEKLRQFRDMGVHVALDDFGTGYSSLSHLSVLPINKLKIDRSLVTNADKQERIRIMLKAIAGMGRDLGLTILAEGVETPAELETLINAVSVEEFQGYLFSRPVPQEALLTLLASDSPQRRKMIARLPQLQNLAA